MGTNLGDGTSLLSALALTTDTAFVDLQNEWDELLKASDQHVYFLRRAWNQIWWKTFRPADSHLFIITCRNRNNQLVGLAPFYIRHRHTLGIEHVREVLFLGTGIYAQTSEYLDLIARRGYEKLVAEAVLGFLSQSQIWDKLSLNEIPASSTVLPHLRNALGKTAQVVSSNHAHSIDTSTDWETFKSTLGRTTRQTTLRLTRRLMESYDCKFNRVETAEQLQTAMDALVRLHQLRWQAKGEPGSFAISGTENLLRQAAQVARTEGRLRLWTLELNSQVVAVQLAFLDNGIAHCLQVGFDPQYARDSVGKIMLLWCVRACIEDPAVREYDLMGGDQPYKDWWAKTSRESVRLIWMRFGMRALAYTSIQLADRMSRALAKAVLPATMVKAGHRLMQRRHYDLAGQVSSPLPLQSR
jgi:CelD/BcsL family acetyltransferase involved in cellulose biosynthesis